ncbi:MAG: hypothetical protein KDD37_00765, partial [Bdellovibrionales bacterium]|nr:hypothetical protein [Bdellovibrionales bacterium]
MNIRYILGVSVIATTLVGYSVYRIGTKRWLSVVAQKYEEKSQLSNQASRGVAATTDAACLPSKPNSQQLQIQVEEMRNSSDVTIQNRLKAWKDLFVFAPDSTEANKCTTLSCAYSKTYPDRVKYMGDLFEIFYLRTGYLINNYLTRSRKPYEGKKFQDYMYFDDEIDSIYTLLNTMPDEFLGMTYLKVIQRMATELVLSFNPLACGQASTGGYILMFDNCLHTDRYTFPEDMKRAYSASESILGSMMHELGHHRDYQLSGSKYARGNRFSERDEWKNLSGWYIKESTDAKTGKVSRQWDNKVGNEGFVSAYAGSEPGEDFAESVSAYRYSPYQFKKDFPKKYKYIKDEVFASEEYTEEALVVTYAKQLTQGVRKAVPKILEACFSTLDNYEANTSWNKLFEGIKIERNIYNCIATRLEDILSEEVSTLKARHLQACNALEDMAEIHQLVINDISDAVKESLGSKLKEADLLRALVQTKKASDNYPLIQLIDIYLDALTKDEPAREYLQSLDKEYARLATSLSEYPSNYEAEKDLFLNKYTFQKVKTAYDEMLISALGDYGENALVLFESLKKKCLDIELPPYPSKANPKLKPFAGGSEYVNPNILSCINDNIVSGAELVVDQRLKDFVGPLLVAIVDNKQKPYRDLLNIVYDHLNQKLLEEIERRRKVEATEVAEIKADLTNIVKSLEIKNLEEFMKNGIKKCAKKVEVVIEQKRAWAEQLKYHQVNIA